MRYIKVDSSGSVEEGLRRARKIRKSKQTHLFASRFDKTEKKESLASLQRNRGNS